MKDAEGPWYPVEYKSDIYQYLKSLERARKPFLNRSPQVLITLALIYRFFSLRIIFYVVYSSKKDRY